MSIFPKKSPTAAPPPQVDPYYGIGPSDMYQQAMRETKRRHEQMLRERMTAEMIAQGNIAGVGISNMGTGITGPFPTPGAVQGPHGDNPPRSKMLPVTTRLMRVADGLTEKCSNRVVRMLQHYDYDAACYQWTALFRDGTRVALTSDEVMSLLELNGELDDGTMYPSWHEQVQSDPARHTAAAKLILTAQSQSK